MKNKLFSQLFVDKNVESLKIAQNYIQYFKKIGLPIILIDHANEIPQDLDFKKNLFLTTKKGGFVNVCPCTPKVVCCGYHNINLIEGCPYNCTYCALDAYLKSNVTKIYCNLNDFEFELNQYLKNKKWVRIGTGELTDSLVWDEIFPYSNYLMSLFKNFPHSILEFKTKSINIEHFFNYPQDSINNILISWSVNTRKMIDFEEDKVASLTSRINAAKEVSEYGYKVGFHFDPIYDYENCISDYKKIIQHIFSKINPSKIGWISLGVIRFNPLLKDLLYDRKSNIIKMELFPSFYDGKLRLFYQRRVDILSSIINFLKSFTDKIYLCMEPLFMWGDLGLDYHNTNKNIFNNFFKYFHFFFFF